MGCDGVMDRWRWTDGDGDGMENGGKRGEKEEKKNK
jgi:hypothetical protein